MHYNQVAFYKAGTSNIFRSTGTSHYAAMTLDVADMEAMSESVASSGYARASGPAIVSRGVDVMAHLRSMHAAAGHSPDSLRDLANPIGRAEAIKRVLIESLRNIIMVAGPRSDTMARQHHELVVRRFLEALELDSLSANTDGRNQRGDRRFQPDPTPCLPRATRRQSNTIPVTPTNAHRASRATAS
jgi:hypothetical protein